MRVRDASELPEPLRRQIEAKQAAATSPARPATTPSSTSSSSSTTSAPRDDREHREQVEFVSWVEIALPGLAECMTAVPHGGHRRKGVAGKLVAEGVRRGYPDVLFDVPRGPWHGLRVEMKAEGGEVSDDQLAWISKLLRHGYLAVVTENAEHAKKIALEYWQLGPFRHVQEA